MLNDSTAVQSFKGTGILVLFLAAGVLTYSLTTALDWDEGFHLLAAFSIKMGKRPYLDFCFPQTMLNGYWNAMWLRVFGESWRALHAVAALLTGGAIALTADFVHRRFRAPGWGTAAASVAALFVGLHAMVFEFGPKAQAYGTCLFLTVAAFRATLIAVEKKSLLWAAAAGCVASAAACCSLLTAPAWLVLLLAILAMSGAENRWGKAAAYVAGALVPAVPVLVALVRSPYVTWFNLVEYHVFFRHVKWEGATQNDLEVMASWVNSGQSLLLGIFAIAGLIYVAKSDWSRSQKAPFYLAAWMAVGLAVEAGVAHPTFPQYFVFIIPFLAMLAAVGFYAVVSRLETRPDRPWRAVPALTLVLLLVLGTSIVDMSENNSTWTDLEKLAAQVAKVNPHGAAFAADPHIYFLLSTLPPSGMEFPASHKLELPPAMAATLHIMPQSVMDLRAKQGEWATVESCHEDEITELGLAKLYSQHLDVNGCGVYWGFK